MDNFYARLQKELDLCYEDNILRLKDKLAWPSFFAGWGALIFIWWLANGH